MGLPKKLASLALNGYVTTLFFASAALSANETLLCEISENQYQHRSENGQFEHRYIEEEPSSANSNGIIELWRGEQRVWELRVWRGCSNGISTCHLFVPLVVDGKEEAEIAAEINYIKLENSAQLIVFSQLREKIAQLAWYTYPGQIVEPAVSWLDGEKGNLGALNKLPSWYVSKKCAQN